MNLFKTILFLTFFSSVALADSPAQSAVQQTIQDAKRLILADKGKLPEAELRAKLEGVVFPVFDFEEMSKRCLGPDWKVATEAERKEFVSLFSKLISRTYYKKVIDNLGESDVTYEGDSVTDGKATVKTLVKSPEGEIDVNYRLKEETSGWKVYDVIVANVSLVSNYRSEFGGIVRREQMSGLIKRLQEKI